MNWGKIAKVVLLALALAVPGGGVAVVGYHAIKYIRNRRTKNGPEVPNSDDPSQGQDSDPEPEENQGHEGTHDNRQAH